MAKWGSAVQVAQHFKGERVQNWQQDLVAATKDYCGLATGY